MLMFMVILQLCLALSMEITLTVFSTQYKIRHFVRFYSKTSYQEGSVRQSVNFQRKIWLHNRNTMSFLNFALEGSSQDVPKQFNSKSFIPIRYKCCLIGSNLCVVGVTNKRVKNWMRWIMLDYWEKHTQWVCWIF